VRRDHLVVVPAYNEADTIEQVVTRALRHADVCVVDDASTDETRDIVERIPGAHCLHHDRNTHIARGILDGFQWARDRGYAWCITMDAGLSHDPDVLPAFLEHGDADLVIGYREQRLGVPLQRRLLSETGRRVMNLVVEARRLPWGGAQLRDCTSGYRMYSRRAFELLLDAPLESTTFDFHIEALTWVYRAGLRIEETPITYEMSNSSLRLSVVGDAVRTAARLWWRELPLAAVRGGD